MMMVREREVIRIGDHSYDDHEEDDDHNYVINVTRKERYKIMKLKKQEKSRDLI